MPAPVTLTRLSGAAFIAATMVLVVLGALLLPETNWLAERMHWKVSLAAAVPVLLAVAWSLNRRAVAHLEDAQALSRLGEARLLVTLQSYGDALIVTDEAGKVTMINPVAQAFTGWREDQARGTR